MKTKIQYIVRSALPCQSRTRFLTMVHINLWDGKNSFLDNVIYIYIYIYIARERVVNGL